MSLKTFARTTALTLLTALFALGLGDPRPAAAAYPPRCFVAFIHGAGSNYHDNPAGSIQYWIPQGAPRAVPDPAARTIVNRVTSIGCRIRAIGYNGDRDFTYEVPFVAGQLRRFIEEEGIGDRGLLVIAHSMGGLVSRYLYNTAEPNSPRHNLYTPAERDTFIRVRRATSHVITLQTPHFGSEGADALYFEASRPEANVNGLGIQAFGIANQTEAYSAMRRSFMEAAVGWIGDEGRTTPIWTIGGLDVRGARSRIDTTDEVASDDDDLALATDAVFGLHSPPVDGLVEERSAHGTSILKENKFHLFPPGFSLEYSSERRVQGAFRPWFSTPLNHNHGRYSDLDTRFFRVAFDQLVESDLGSLIVQRGLDLPCSDATLSLRTPGCPGSF